MAILIVTTEPGRARSLTALPDVDAIVESEPGRVREEVGRQWRLVIVDVELPSAPELIADSTRAGNVVLLLAGEPSLPGVMDALASGAQDVVRDGRDARILRRWLTRARVQRHDWRVASQQEGIHMWVGRSAVSLAVMATAGRAALTDTSVMLLGERGVGKELLARVIHARSERKEGIFAAVHCGAMDQVGLSAELFGSEIEARISGATPAIGQLERAAGGVIYLEEISALNPALQVRLGRALAEGVFERLGSVVPVPLRARVMASSTTDLRREVDDDRFDERLFYEFGMRLHVPALRQRSDDIPLLAAYFVERYGQMHGREVGFSADSVAQLGKYDWPGNVRQLRHVVERAVVSCGAEVIEPADLMDELKPQPSELDLSGTDDLSLDAVERRHIRRVLHMTSGRISEAADMLGIHRNTLRRKLEQYGLSTEG